MEYVQMTLNDWLSLKQELQEEFRRASASFVKIGYLLRKAEDSEGYKNDGYDTLAEWAHDELGLSATYVSRFKAINAKYSRDGYSEMLRPEYIGFGSAKLGEMLALPDEDMQMVTPQTKRDDIRALKEFNREAPQAESSEAWIRDMMAVQPDNVLRELAKTKELGTLNGKACAEILNPGGNRMVRTKAAMIAMTEDGVIVKTFGPEAGRKNLTWQEFADMVIMLFVRGEIKTPAGGEGQKETRSAEVHREKPERTPAEDVKPVAPAQIRKEKPRAEPKEEADEEPAGEPEEAGEPDMEPEEEPDPGPDIPPERMQEYIKALGDAREKLDQIENQFRDSNWAGMSDCLIQLGFIVSQLKVLYMLGRNEGENEDHAGDAQRVQEE